MYVEMSQLSEEMEAPPAEELEAQPFEIIEVEIKEYHRLNMRGTQWKELLIHVSKHPYTILSHTLLLE